MRNVAKMLKVSMFIAASMFVFISFAFPQQTMLLTESFESALIPPGTIPPPGWALEQISGTSLGVNFVTESIFPTINSAFDGTNFVQYNSYNISIGSTRLKMTDALTTTDKSFILVDFAWFEDPGYTTSNDIVEVQWSTDGANWYTAAAFSRYNAVEGWKVKNVVLPSGANNQTTLFIAFLFTTAYGNNCALDLVHVTAGPAAPPAFVTIGTGTAPVGWPYYTLYQGSRTQMLYTADQLTAAGASTSNFTSIGFNVVSSSTQLMTNFTVKMGHTANSTLTGWVASGMNTVYQVDYTVPGTGWRDIVLTNPFPWNGTSNVVVEICFGDNGSWLSNSTVMGAFAVGTTWHYHDDAYAGCIGTAAGAVQTATPNIRFGVPPMNLAVLMGYVKDINTMAPIAGAVVQVGSVSDTSRANGFYILYNLNAGQVTTTCTAAGYVAGSETATIVTGEVTNLDILMTPGPNVSGTVTDASTGAPVAGAVITIGAGLNAVTVLTIADGTYLSPLLSVSGPQPIVIGKTGYDNVTGTVTLAPNTTAFYDTALLPTAVQPGLFIAALNNPVTPTSVNLNWGVPQGMYQIIYDDGTQDNLAIWTTANNLNALKFTPLAWPVKLVGGKVNLGTSVDYPSGALPFTVFKMMVYKADGAGGVPGTVIDSIEVTPTGFGWANFSFASPITINSGDFYLVMKQGGVPPHAAGIGVDTAGTQLRSYSKFVTGGGSWVPAAGSYMMRAIMQGTGGPILADNFSTEKELITASAVNGLIYQIPVSTVTGYEGVADYQPLAMTYQVWRLLQGQEGTPASWPSIWTGNVNTTIDNGWPTLPAGAYRWAVEAIYSPPLPARFSAPTFSNVIGNNWIANVNVCVTLTCAANSMAGTIVKLTNTVYPDTNYTKTTDTTGCVHFTRVWKGTYTLTANRFSYPVYSQNLVVMGDVNQNITMLQTTEAPTNLAVNDVNLKATWSPPRAKAVQFTETWASGNFTANSWVPDAGSNWGITTTFGNPAPSAIFNWTPALTGYDQMLTSKPLAGLNAPAQRLKYDIYLSNFGTTAVNTMAVELWNGTTWTVLKTYTNSGNIPWTSDDLDISAATHNPAFKIRFHAAGEDSYYINNWNIDNIQVYSADAISGPNACVIGYNFYLNGAQVAFTPDTTYFIPPDQVVYGQHYQACVAAVYGSGYSSQICVNFTAHYLYPARDLTATGIECNAYLMWKKPVTPGGTPQVPPGLIGYIIYRDGDSIHYNPHQDSLTYYNYGLNPGTYKYEVKARYDLSVAPYNLPAGTKGISLGNTAGEKTVTLDCGTPLPFYEPWDPGTFSYNSWSPTDHWTMNTGIGNPAPCADFTWQPAIANYSKALTSEVINASPWTCAKIWLDFDLKLIDRNNTGKEKMTIDIYYGGSWHQKMEVTSNGSTNWLSRHIDISVVKGKSFRIRFVANGVNSADILHWYVDNIHAYGICTPATALTSLQSQFTTTLTWAAPDCPVNFSQPGYADNSVSDSSVITGFNVYRTSASGVAPYALLNAAPLLSATYVDTYPATLASGTFKYFVSVLYRNTETSLILCEPSTDTILVTFPHVGVNELTNGKIMVYPNPVADILNIRSDCTITSVDVMNFAGQTVYATDHVYTKTAELMVSKFNPGVYFLKVSSLKEIRTVKITVIR